jgi:hypothetical protein
MAIWLLAVFVFAMMIVVVFAKIISENRTKDETTPEAKLQTVGKDALQSKKNFSARD